jgi:hypothetical protein
LFHGRFCVQWGELQNEHLYRIRDDLPTKNKASGQKWQGSIINVLWEQWYELWTSRNEDVHGKDAAARALAERREVKRKLTVIYDNRNQMEASYQEQLFPDIQMHLAQPVWVIQDWLKIRASGFVTSIRTAKTRAIQNVRSIRSYFGNPQV